jgi:large subunit ribosomal protein L23
MSLFKKSTTKATKETKANQAPVAMKDMYEQTDKPVTKTEHGKETKSRQISQAYRILIRPLVSEKASRQQTSFNQYSFVVANQANKIEIAKAIKAVYGIKPLKVNLSRLDGKIVSRGRTFGQRKNWKKAIVTLPKGKTITLYEGV